LFQPSRKQKPDKTSNTKLKKKNEKYCKILNYTKIGHQRVATIYEIRHGALECKKWQHLYTGILEPIPYNYLPVHTFKMIATQ
jgi:hypothetical protein